MSDKNRYTGGYLGLITGANNDSATSTVKIVGLSVQGGNYPYELNGNKDATFVRKSVNDKGEVTCDGNAKGNNYVIFSDYTGNSFTGIRNTEGTIGSIDSKSNYPVNTPAPDPYVIINASSELKVYSSDKDTTGMKLTSDGMNDNAKKVIISDLTQETGSKIYQQKYQRVRYAKENGDQWALANVAKKFDSTSGEYKDRLSTYFTASESKKSDYTGIDDFAVLMIDTSKSSEITQMIYEYLSVLTNCDQTGICSANGTLPADKAQYTSMNAYTYRWNGAKFVKTENASLIINEADHSVSVRAGAHDNQNNQFTVLDVYYANPGNTKEGYHLFIPVVVKKILQTEFSIKMRNGSSAYGDAYTSNAAMLANYGEDFTAQLIYSYIWTADEWNANIAAGKPMEQNTYTLGKFYNVTDVTITPEGEDKTGSIKSETNDYIDLDLSAKITIPEAYRTQFDTYANNDPVYFRFAIQMHNQSQDDTGSDQILTNAVQALSVKLGSTELSAEDYTCEVSDGVLYLLVKNKKGIDFSDTTVTAQLRLNYSGGEIDAQFPMRKGSDQTSGITFSTNAAIAYSESSLDGSSMSSSGKNDTKFYRETISSVELTYRAYDTVSEDGNVSQLGINGKEVAGDGGITITTQGTYNATDMSGLNTTDENNDAYPYYLAGSLELQKKTTDSDGNTVYQTVKMSDYMKSVSLKNGTIQEASGDNYTFKMQLTKEQVSSLATEPLKIDFSYFVKSDEALEKLGNQAQYANYKVILTAHLANKSGTALVEDVSDYLIYTNAKFYNGIISTRDFGQK